MSLRERVAKALETDNNIVCPANQTGSRNGFTEAYFAQLGLTQADLKKLERMGLAARGYTKNVWLSGETLPNGKVVENDVRYNGRGHGVRWILLTEPVEASDVSGT